MAALHVLSIVFLALGGLCCLVILADLSAPGRRQHMWIMNVVWPVTALFGTLLSVAAYFKWGRLSSRRAVMAAKRRGEEPPARRLTPFPAMVAKGAAHCGSGCALGDIVAETLGAAVPAVAVGFGWKWLFGHRIFAIWIFDYVLAFLFGIAFQYFTIQPMRQLPPLEGLKQALKADTLSLTAWQLGMYGWMGVSYFIWFGLFLGVELRADMPEFWFMMQIAMLCGFATSYPVNWWLLRKGIKEKM